jgi:hypothetical protein
MNKVPKILTIDYLLILTGCYFSKYHHSEEISFVSDYPRLVREGAVTHFDTYVTENEIMIFVYKKHGKMYKIKEAYNQNMGATVKRDLK